MWKRLLIVGAATATAVLTAAGVAHAQEGSAGADAGGNGDAKAQGNVTQFQPLLNQLLDEVGGGTDIL